MISSQFSAAAERRPVSPGCAWLQVVVLWRPHQQNRSALPAHPVLGHAEPKEGLVAGPHLHDGRPRVQVKPLRRPRPQDQGGKEDHWSDNHIIVVSLGHSLHSVVSLIVWDRCAAWCGQCGRRRSTEWWPRRAQQPLPTAVSCLSCVLPVRKNSNWKLKTGKLKHH